MRRVFRTTIVTLVAAVLGAISSSAQQVVNLSDAGPTGTAVQWIGPQSNARAGTSLLRADMNGDVDRADLIVGAPGAGPAGEGRAYILFMGPTYATGSLSASASATMTGESAGDEFGAAVTAGMIVHQEQQPARDLVVSAPAALGGRGVVYLFPGPFGYGDNRSASTAPYRIVGAPGDRLGSALISADLDNDGYREIIMSAPGTGRVYIVFGGPSLSGTRDLTTAAADVTITAPTGAVTLSSGDFNGDGLREIVVGVPSSGAGTIYLITGKPRASFAASFALSAADAQFTGVDASDQAGASLQALDLDGDGVTDLAIGAPGAGGPSNSRAASGEVYVLWGSTAFATSRSLSAANVTIYGASAGNRLGAALGAGHVRRDKPDDLLLLAPGASAAGDIDMVYGAQRRSFASTVDLANGIDRVLHGDPAGAPLQSIATTQVTGKADDIIAGAPAGSANGMSASGSVFAVFSPAFQLDPGTTSVTVAQGATATATVRIKNVGSLNVGWTARTNTSSVTISPAAGTTSATTSGQFTLTVSPGTVAPGTYHGGFSYLSTNRDMVWADTGSVDITVVAASGGGVIPKNLFGLPSDPDEGSPDGVNTPVGSNVTVVPIRDFLVTFSNVTQAGRTRVDVQPSSGTAAAGTRSGPFIYTVKTTAVFSGPVIVAVAYQDFSTFENAVRLLQGTADVTTSVNTTIHAVYGTVASIPATVSVLEDRRRFVTVTPTGLVFSATKNGRSGDLVSTPTPQVVTVSYEAGITGAWTATSAQSWATITNGSGDGPGSFSIGIANPGNVIGRNTDLNTTVTVSIPSQSLTIPIPVRLLVNQVTSCVFTLSSAAVRYTVAGGTGSVTVNTDPTCAWIAADDAGFVTMTGGSSGTGTGTVEFTVASNPGTASRQATIKIGDATFTITQDGVITASPMSLTFGAAKNGAGGAVVHKTSAQQVRVLFGSGTTGAWTATSADPWIQVTNGSGTGSGTFTVGISDPGNTIGGRTDISSTVTISIPTLDVTIPVSVRLIVKQNAGATTAPVGAFDTPTANQTVAGSVAVTGWAVDDIEVTRVEIWRDRVPGETTPVFGGPGPGTGKIFIANAFFVDGARPDVEAAFPNSPLRSRTGWGYLMLTWGLFNQGNGPFTLYAFAYDADGHSTMLGRVPITSDNAHATRPFGSIDTPAYGATVTEPFWNFGWALTPNASPSCAVSDGNVFAGIDSGALIPVSYGALRTDIAAGFSGFTNGANGGGAYYLDTSTLTNGLHSIGWFVTDSCGRSDGVGSRFFNVANGAASSSLSAAVAEPALPQDGNDVAWEPISVSKNLGAMSLTWPSTDGAHVIAIEQTDHISVQLPSTGGRYRGYQIVNGEERPLPIGSTFDAAAGVFSWQPAAGFIGSYDLGFANGGREPLRVRVIIGRGVRMFIDAPVANAVVQQPFAVGGWALDLSEPDVAGVDAVHVWAYRRDVENVAPQLVGAVLVDGNRPDVATVYGSQFQYSGFTITATSLAPGTYDLMIYPWLHRTAQFAAPSTVRVVVK